MKGYDTKFPNNHNVQIRKYELNYVSNFNSGFQVANPTAAFSTLNSHNYFNIQNCEVGNHSSLVSSDIGFSRKNSNLFNDKDQNSKRNQRKKFDSAEDAKLKQLVSDFGPKKWDLIAQYMPGRTGRQCRDRYKNYLMPGFFNGEWTNEEDQLLFQKFSEIGPHWSRLKIFFPNRSSNSLKNRWNYFVSRQYPKIPTMNTMRNHTAISSGSQNSIDRGNSIFQEMSCFDMRSLSGGTFDDNEFFDYIDLVKDKNTNINAKVF